MQSLSLKLFLSIFLLIGFTSHSQIISQYVETNSGTTPKGIEIWNNTSEQLDFSINNLIIEKGVNGGTPSEDFTLETGTLSPGAVLIIGTSDMESAATANGVDFFEKGFTFNGDDALVVKYGISITDVFGTPGSDPGSAWTGSGVSTANQNIQLIEGVSSGELSGFTDPSTRFETVNTDPSGVNGLEGFGIAPTSGTSPVLTASVFSLTDFTYQIDNGPSASQSLSLSGNNLDGTDVQVELPTASNFEIANTETGTFSNSITLSAFDGSPTDIFVRLKSDLTFGLYNDVISISGGGASAISLDLEGEVIEPVFLLYDFIGNNTAAVFSPDNAVLSEFSISEANVTFGTTGTWSGSGTPYAQGNSGWGAMSPDVAKNFFFVLHPDAGFRANLTNISFEWRTTGAGPSVITVEINGIEIATFNSGSNEQAIFNQNLSGFNDLSEVIVRIKGWDNDSRSTSGGGDFRINDVKLEGEIIDKPFDYVYESGSWTPQSPVGQSTNQDDILIKDGNLSFNDELFSDDFEISNSATVDILSVLNISGDLIVNGNLTFKSDLTGSAQLLHSTTSNIIGDIAVERFIPAKRAFRFLSSPVGGESFANSWQQDTHITGDGGDANGFDNTTTNNPSLFTYDNQITNPAGGAGWTAVTSTNEVLEAGKPYRLMVRGDRTINLTDNEAEPSITTLTSKGQMLSGELTTGNQLQELSQFVDTFSFIANPYQAVVDFTELSTTGLTNFIYVWDAKIGGDNGKGGYVTVDLSGLAPDPSSSEASEFIIPGQALFVKNTEELTETPSVTFTPNAIASGQPQPEILSENTQAYINIKLYKAEDFINGSMEADAAGLRFSEDFTTPPSDEDAVKFIQSGENIAIINQKILSIDKRTYPENEDIIQIVIGNYQQADYTLNFNFDALPQNKALILIDNYLQEEVEVTEGFSYNFSVDSSIEESENESRFQLKFVPVTLSDKDFELSDSVRVYPNPVKGLLTLDGLKDNEIEDVQIYSVLGQELLINYSIEDEKVQIDASGLSEGLYFIKIETDQGSASKRFIKN